VFFFLIVVKIGIPCELGNLGNLQDDRHSKGHILLKDSGIYCMKWTGGYHHNEHILGGGYNKIWCVQTLDSEDIVLLIS
jgi:hypothetical protein